MSEKVTDGVTEKGRGMDGVREREKEGESERQRRSLNQTQSEGEESYREIELQNVMALEKYRVSEKERERYNQWRHQKMR